MTKYKHTPRYTFEMRKQEKKNERNTRISLKKMQKSNIMNNNNRNKTYSNYNLNDELQPKKKHEQQSI